MQKICATCGKAFEAIGRGKAKAKYCSDECRIIARRERDRERARIKYHEKNNDPAFVERRREITRKAMRKYRSRPEYKEQNRLRMQEYRKKPGNREKHKEYDRKSYQKHREKRLAYYHAHKELSDKDGTNFCVYLHVDPLGLAYVGRTFGKTCEDANRNRWRSGSGYRGYAFYEAVAKYGWENIEHSILEWGLTYKEAREREEYWINRFKSNLHEYGWNRTSVHEGVV